jgi:thymidylate kinase
VAVLGPDGSGKSSVIDKYLSALETTLRGNKRYHLRPRLLRGSAAAQATNTNPHGQESRGILASVAKLLFLWADYVLGYLLSVRPLLVCSTLVVFDRYFHDLLIDPRRFRYGGPRWLIRFVARLIPLPDLMLVLYAPAHVLQTRKQEVTVEESTRQAETYRAIADSAAFRGHAFLVDAARPLDQVVYQCLDQTIASLSKRTAKRLHLK